MRGTRIRTGRDQYNSPIAIDIKGQPFSRTDAYRRKRLTKCVGALPSSRTISVCLTAPPSMGSRDNKSLALALVEATPRLTMLSNRERRGFAPNSSYELGRGRRLVLEPSTSLWNRPRGSSLRSSKEERGGVSLEDGGSWEVGVDPPP